MPAPIRYQPKARKVWRTRKARNARITITAVISETTKPTAITAKSLPASAPLLL
jgi:hypothetical protein